MRQVGCGYLGHHIDIELPAGAQAFWGFVTPLEMFPELWPKGQTFCFHQAKGNSEEFENFKKNKERLLQNFKMQNK